MIISSVKHNKKCSILKDIRRMYIGFVHAKKKLMIVGSMNNLKDV